MTELHQVNRRIFIRDFGRGVLGISIGSFLLTACADDAVVASSTMPAPGTQATSAAAITTTAAVAPPTTIQTGSTELAIERVNMGFVSAYLMVRGADVALVDTGSGGSEDQIEQALSEVGLAWGSVGTVILTHNHPDHAGSLSAVLSQVSDAVVGTGADDIGGVGGVEGLVAFSDGQEVFGATIIATPGHTPGHIAVWDEVTRVLIAGDALTGSGSMVENTDGVGGPPPAFTPDMASAVESARKLAALEPDTIFFGHGEPKSGDAARALNTLVEGL